MKMAAYWELRIWKEARALVMETYAATKAFPSYEKFELAGQMRRASMSVASVIAEGTGKRTPKEFMNYLHMALGSAHEMSNHYTFAKDLQFMDLSSAEALIHRYRGLAAGIRAYILKIEKEPRRL